MIDCCCQAIVNCTPEIVQFEPGWLGFVVLRAGCNTITYVTAISSLAFVVLIAFLGVVLGWLIHDRA